MGKVYGIKYTDGTTETCTSWEDCKSKVHGVKGVLYKGFEDYVELNRWMARKEIAHVDEDNEKTKLYVDGSFINGYNYAGWAFVIVKCDHILGQGRGITPWPAKSRNIDGEVYAAGQAISYFKQNIYRVGSDHAQLVHDYFGISAWLTGDWSYKSDIAAWYVHNYKKYANILEFIKIKGHQGNRWNEYVDKMAKLAINEERKIRRGKND